MTATARIAGKTVVLALTLTVGALAVADYARASAGPPQICAVSKNCTIGEFVYNDEYVPVTSATCTVTSRYPDGSLFLNSQTMTGAADGWYAYSFTTPNALGYYRTQVCCTVGSDYLCLDKSFEAAEAFGASELASAVWNHGNRTLTSFGTLVSDIWGHSARSLTGFGSLIQDLWKHNPRSLTDGGSANLKEIEKTVKENRLMLEKLVNKPIIQNFIEEEEVDLGAQLTRTKELASGLYLDTQMVVSKMGVVLLSWEEMTGEEIFRVLKEVGESLGRETDTSSAGAVMGRTKALAEIWEWQEAREALDLARAAAKSVALAERKLKGAGGWKSAYPEVKNALVRVENLERLVGSSSDKGGTGTIYARLNEVSELALRWDEKLAAVDKLLKGWKSDQAIIRQGEIEKLGQAILAMNKVPKGYEALVNRVEVREVEKRVKNKLLALRGLAEANKRYLARGDRALASTWLEEGSVIFKSLVTNPSSLISQEVELKYYLPSELKEEDVLETDAGLEVKFDSEKNQLYVQGRIALKPGESRTVFVRVDDVWKTSKSEIESLRRQAEELARPLEKTALFAQGVTLKSDIDVALDKIEVLEATAVTPEQKIRAWREGQIEMGGVKVKIEKMKDLVAQVSASGNLFGFVGGAQVMAVWGLVIIFVAGFVFLALYMRMISARGESASGKEVSGEHKQRHHSRSHRSGWKIAISVLVTAIISSMTSGIMVRKMMLDSQVPGGGVVAGEKAVEASEGRANKEEAQEESLGVGGPEVVRIEVDEGAKVNLRTGPGVGERILGKADKSFESVKLEEETGWVKVEWKGLEVWVAEEFVVSQEAVR